MNDRQEMWDRRYIDLAQVASKWSKDPGLNVGCVLVRPDNTVCSVGFNGFPTGIADDERLNDRDLKLKIVIHAELNAIMNARESLNGYTAYCNYIPCVTCAAHLIEAGVKRVVAPYPDEELLSRWKKSIEMSEDILAEAGVELITYD